MAPKQKRLYLGLSTKEMMLALNVDRGTLDKWERGDRTMNTAANTAYDLLIWLHDDHSEIFYEYLLKQDRKR
jgi:transcriptional regulator with XRE-family HTH domain